MIYNFGFNNTRIIICVQKMFIKSILLKLRHIWREHKNVVYNFKVRFTWEDSYILRDLGYNRKICHTKIYIYILCKV